MKIFRKIFEFVSFWLSDVETYISLLTDIRTTSATVIIVGGVGRFFDFTNPDYVIIGSIVTWIACSLVLKDLNRRRK